MFSRVKFLLAIIAMLFVLNVFPQKETNTWYFGRKAGVDFNTNPPSALTDGELETFEGCSSFSDANGNLLFYVGAPNTESDRLTVWDKNHTVMKYTDGTQGNDLLGHASSAQSAMIIPKPGSSHIYYVFTVGDQFNPNFSLYTIDMSLNDGKGQLIDEDNDGNYFVNLAKNTSDFNTWTEKVTAVKSKKCNTYWVVSLSGNNFYSYEINTNGVHLTPVVSTVTNYTAYNTRGHMKLSPDGTKLVVAHENIPSKVFMYSFNSLTGEVSDNAISLFNENEATDGRAYGVEFSVDSKKLYITSSSKFILNFNDPIPSIYKLFQYDLSASNILDSKYLIYKNDKGFRGALQMGPDGKIYTMVPEVYDDIRGDASYLSAIENPSDKAEDIIFTEDAISLNGRLATQGLPPFISSLMLLPITIIDLSTERVVNNKDLDFCLGDDRTLVPEELQGNSIIYKWFFQKELIATSRELVLNNITREHEGKYELEVRLIDNCGNHKKYEASFNVITFEAANATKPTDIEVCDEDGFYSFNLQDAKSAEILNGQDAAMFEVVYFDSLEKAHANSSGTALPNEYINSEPFASRTIFARVQNKSAKEACYAITSFQLLISNIPKITTPTPYVLCDDTDSGSNTDGITINFKLGSRDKEILGDLEIDKYNVLYYDSLNDAETNTNSIDKEMNYSVTNSKKIYVRVENKENTNCSTISNDDRNSSFKPLELIVAPLPIVSNTELVFVKDDTDLDLVTTFNLTEYKSSISSNSKNETFEYFETKTAAYNEGYQIENPLKYLVEVEGEVWVKITSEYGCSKIRKIKLIVSFDEIHYNKKFIACDDFLNASGSNTIDNSDTDGISFFNLNEAKQEVFDLYPKFMHPNLEVSFYEKEEDRDAFVNQMINLSSHRNNGDSSYAHQQTIYINIKNKLNNISVGNGKLYLKVIPIPSFEVMGEEDLALPLTICSNNPSLMLEVKNPEDAYSYEWLDENNNFLGDDKIIEVNKAGKYKVTAYLPSDLGCATEKTIIVKESNAAKLLEEFVTITDASYGIQDKGNFSVAIDTTFNRLGIGDYQFALLNINNNSRIPMKGFQDEPIFRNLENGVYKIIVNDKNGCVSDAELVVYLIQFPNFFTPNNDGENDTWQIRGINEIDYSSISINLFNRHGILITKVPINSEGWDGTMKGEKLPSGEYWFNFTINFSDPSIPSYSKKSHFSLLRNKSL